MRVSAKAEYACVAMMELAGSYETGQPVNIRTIAEAHEIPPGFLVQILLQLKGAGYVVSTRGALGGYRLAKDPVEISVAEVLMAIDGPDEASGEEGSTALKELRKVWQKVNRRQQQMLEEVSIAELTARVQQQSSEMYYI